MQQPKGGVTTIIRWRLDALAALATFLVMLLFGCTDVTAQHLAAAPQQQASTSSSQASGASAGYRLGSGDHVRVTVFGEQDLSGEYQVDGTGKLAFPLIGQVQAGGLTAAQLQNELSAKLSPNYIKNPAVSVEVLTYRPFYIVGEVRTPGSYPYVSGMTVINAVALAGGFTYRAKENDFYLTRGKVRMDANPETPVQPGDVITVRERYF